MVRRDVDTRPNGISPTDLDKVIDSVIADLGEYHGNRNFLDLTLMLFSPIKFGSGNELRSEALALVKGGR
jgi:hypothetical protein